MSQQIKDMMRRWFDSNVDGTYPEVAPQLFHEKYTYHVDAKFNGVPGITALARRSSTAFPDVKFTILLQTCEGDWLTTLFVLEGTHLVDTEGLPASGRRLRSVISSIARVEDGKFIEEWEIYDNESVMRQLYGEAQ